MGEAPLPEPRRPDTVAAEPARLWALAGVMLAHGGLLAVMLWNQPTPAVALSPPAVVGVLVSAHSEPVTAPPTPPLPLAVPRPTPAPAPAPVRELPPSERAPVAPPQPPAVPTEPTVAAESTPAPASPAAPATSGDSSATGPVTPPRSDAAHLNNPKPVYPAVSRRLKEEGTVVLDVFIQTDGSVGDVRVKRSSGYPRLDEAALTAVRRWKYVPARRGSEPLALWHSQSLVFSLVR